MALPPQKFREIVFQLLYSYDMGSDQNDMIPMIMSELEVTKASVKDAQDRVRRIIEKKDQIDPLIANSAQAYSFDRISSVELNIIRLALFEIFHDETIPAKVAIAEAIRLARKFGTPESATFVNAILDQIYKNKIDDNSSKI